MSVVLPVAGPTANIPAVADKKEEWKAKLSETAFVNWLAISDDGSRVVADTYYYPYVGTTSAETQGTFGIYCFDSKGTRHWYDEYEGDEGVFSVAISGNGKVAAAGGLHGGGGFSDRPDSGFLRAYDADSGKRILDYKAVRRRINSMALSDDGDVLAAVSNSKLYVFVRKCGKFPDEPSIPVSDGNVLYNVAVHSSGKWLVACDRGRVHLVTISNGAVDKTFTWKAPLTPLRETTVPIPFLSVAISKWTDIFVVGGGNVVYLFSKDSMIRARDPIQFIPIDPATALPAALSGQKQDIRWVAISGDGSFVAAVVNKQQAGELRGLTHKDGKLSLAWEQPLDFNPNSTSVDAAGEYVTACDGNPVGTPGKFYLFDSAGNKLWDVRIQENMNWPMFINAEGSAIAAGSDNGHLYYFLP